MSGSKGIGNEQLKFQTNPEGLKAIPIPGLVENVIGQSKYLNQNSRRKSKNIKQ
jgi:hypothetical protein